MKPMGALGQEAALADATGTGQDHRTGWRDLHHGNPRSGKKAMNQWPSVIAIHAPRARSLGRFADG